MTEIFPGMDPWLEDTQLWPGVHAALLVYLRDQLQPLIRPRYIAAVEERVYLEGPEREIIPDVSGRRPRAEQGGRAVAVLEADAPVVVNAPPLEVHETYVAILDRRTEQRVVTVIEVTSPTNKYAGPGWVSYQAKQREVLSSDTHLVEIDLLRAGPHVLAVPEWAARGQGPYDYLVCVNRAQGLRGRYELYLRTVRQPLPRIRIPLAGEDRDVVLGLQALLVQTYDAGSYRDRINYDTPCTPRLTADDHAWADQLIRQARQPLPPTP